MKKIVIKDIAKLAGVSRSTVSKAINNYSDIPEKTKEKIQKVIAEYNYRPSKSARELRMGKNDSMAFMSGRIASHFTVEVLSAIEKRTFLTGKYVHGIVPYSTNYKRKVMDEIFGKILYGREASAIVALAMNPDPGILLKYREAGIPLILIENLMKNAHSVNTDNRKGGFIAAEYLIKKGRKRIGLICGGLKTGSKAGFSYAAVERKAGFDEALELAGIKHGGQYLELASDYTIAEGMEIFERFVGKGVKLDAVFCASGDMTAVGVMESAKKHGMSIPDDLAVIGFDDSSYSAFFDPPLTTVRQPIEKLGAEVFNTAVAAIEGKLKSFKHITIEPELIIRKSA
jgi:DNA-binding LacI/PurR family transcriptional regulator